MVTTLLERGSAITVDVGELQGGSGGMWHGMAWVCDPNTKVRIELIWHEAFPDPDAAELAVLDRMTVIPAGWGAGTIAYAPKCPACSTN